MSFDRLARMSQRMATATLWLTVTMLLLNAASWLFPSITFMRGESGLGAARTAHLISQLGLDIAAFPWWQKVGAVLLSSVPLIALAGGLGHLRLLFRAYGRREYFSASAARHLGKVGRAVVLWVVLNFLCEPLLSVWLTLREPVGHRAITLSVGSPDVVALFLAASIAVIARILQQASELDSEHRLIV
jgi:Protein of unknown function (DUF2975)